MIFASFLVVLAFGVAALAIFRAGRSAADKDTAEAEAKASKGDAQKWANRPRSLRAAATRAARHAV